MINDPRRAPIIDSGLASAAQAEVLARWLAGKRGRVARLARDLARWADSFLGRSEMLSSAAQAMIAAQIEPAR